MRRDPGLLALLARSTPACEAVDVVWARPLRLTSYIGAEVDDVPDALVTSIRVLVRVGDDVVVCTNVDGSSHPWPGGRREPGETYTETACREVHEETGWILDPSSLEPLGWLHVHNLGDELPPYPHPDVVHLVYTGRAEDRAAEDWTDTEGQEISSRLLSLDEALTVSAAGDPLSVPFVELLRARA
jgi:ADP-ribose pyrophosphatase YjhB (NUDIX family)